MRQFTAKFTGKLAMVTLVTMQGEVACMGVVIVVVTIMYVVTHNR